MKYPDQRCVPYHLVRLKDGVGVMEVTGVSKRGVLCSVWLEADALYPFESQGLGERFHSSIDDLRESIWIAIPMLSSKIACQVINNN